MADTPQKVVSRPLSPHLGIYRWPITMATSIVHRMTGVALAGSTLLVAWWLIAAASGPEAYDFFGSIAASLLGQLVLFGFVWSLAYHLVNGIRHLAWDFGYGFAPSTANKTGVLVFALSLLLAVGAFALVYLGKGGYYQ
ncbi:MAG: succinate dehydrogenase, cytochrome b556 subunit [Alphaproteobacteria bacterium]|nr:succinate dehydrogenase, cytochrome b556 subunit [Alphaproteobacteria bacterium]MDE2110663.1 succinate dehydrogenase, cytochrome b556 subunit [Alphaproteobacteria bacterium]MDE2493086.1 succinate dehydrogenase, cytochrome b556 subunit [Alphaproteobacteria bacterium]